MSTRRPVGLGTRRRVSVVVPCYQYGHFLPTAVASALDQDGLDLEVIVVDDASPDGSAAVARALADADPRVRVVEHPLNRGHIATYNDGLALVTGDYVVLLSADDALPRNALTRAVALMEANPGVGLVYGFPQRFVDEPPEAGLRVRSWSVWAGNDWLGRALTRGRNPILSPEVVLRRAAWDQLGRYDDRLPHAADMLAWYSTASRWQIGRVNGPPQAYYRVHGTNMHLSSFGGALRDLVEQTRVLEILWAEHGPIADADRLARQASGALARRALDEAVAARRAGDDAAATALLALAVEQDPTVTGTRRWRRRDVVPRGFAARIGGLVSDVNDAVVWRRWRRYGT